MDRRARVEAPAGGNPPSGSIIIMPSRRISTNDVEKAVFGEARAEAIQGPHPEDAAISFVRSVLGPHSRVWATWSHAVLDLVWMLQLTPPTTHRDSLVHLFPEIEAEFTDEAVRRLAGPWHVFGPEIVQENGESVLRWREISGLDPGSEDELEACWGGLTRFAERVSHIVADHVVEE